MKTTQECWQALIDGERLVEQENKARIVRLEEGFLAWDHNGEIAKVGLFYPQDWDIYTPPKWYENIPEGGVLCWLNNNGDRCQRKGVITTYSKFDGFLAEDEWYQHATPLKKQEIQTLLDNAPEGEDQ